MLSLNSFSNIFILVVKNNFTSSLVLPGGGYKLATKWEVLFANTSTQIDSKSFSSSVIGICEMSLWTSNMAPPPWIFLSFLYTLYGQVSGKSSKVAIELSILVFWIATTCGWWKSRKASNSSFLPLILLIFMLMNFNPLIKLNTFLSSPHLCFIIVFICDLFVSRDDTLMS